MMRGGRQRHRVANAIGVAASIGSVLITAAVGGGPAFAAPVGVSVDAVPGAAPGVSTVLPRGDIAPAPLARFYRQRITWTDCGDSAQCATVKVPRSYDRPDGATLRVAVSRRVNRTGFSGSWCLSGEP